MNARQERRKREDPTYWFVQALNAWFTDRPDWEWTMYLKCALQQVGDA